jgi:hypothetical protein
MTSRVSTLTVSASRPLFVCHLLTVGDGRRVKGLAGKRVRNDTSTTKSFLFYSMFSTHMENTLIYGYIFFVNMR